MGKPEYPNPEKIGEEVETACGSLITLAAHTPWVVFRNEVAFLCQLECRLLYEKDPRNSCLAGRVLSGR